MAETLALTQPPPGEESANVTAVSVEVQPTYEVRPTPGPPRTIRQPIVGDMRPPTAFAPRNRVSNEALNKTGLEDNAHVWTVYCTEADRYDAELILQWKETTSLLTTYSGLLSVVISAFLIVASITRDTPSGGISGRHPSLWIYALWFTSISLSLSVSIACLNSRQWLNSFRPLPVNKPQNPRQRALLRQFRYSGIEQWNLPLIMSLLPQFLVLSIFLFFAGLILFLHPLSQLIATIIIAVTGMTLFLYITSTALPILSPQSPFSTPVTHLAYDLIRQYGAYPDIASAPSLSHKELAIVSDPREYLLSASALSWLYGNTSDPATHLAVYEALLGFDRSLSSSSSDMGSQMVRSVHDATSHMFKRPNMVFGLFQYFLRTASEDNQWPKSRQGRRLGRACKFYFGREDANSERLWAQINSPDCIDSTFPDTVRSVLRIVNDHPPSRSRRGGVVHFPDTHRRILDRQGNQSNPGISTPGRDPRSISVQQVE